MVSRHALASWFVLGLGCGQIPGSDPPDPAEVADAAVAVTDAGAAADACDGYDRIVDPETQHCYVLITGDRQPWAGAAERCVSVFDRADRGHLVTITSAAEDALVRELVGDVDAWIGGTDAKTEGTWTWVTGEAVTLVQWIAAEPNDAAPDPGEDCMTMKLSITAGGWNDDACSDAWPFVCERD